MASLETETIRYKFGCIYRFFEPAVEEILNRLSRLPTGKETLCVYNDKDHVFDLECGANGGDATFNAFADIVIGLIETEVCKGLTYNGPKIGVIAGIPSLDPDMELDSQDDVDTASASLLGDNDELIDVDIIYAWQPRIPGPAFIQSLQVDNQQSSKVISALTDCALQIDDSCLEVIIKGHGTEKVEIAASKLDNLERDFYRADEIVAKCFVDIEGEEELKLRMVAIPNLRDKTLETILVDSERPFIDGLTFLEAVPSLYALRIAKKGTINYTTPQRLPLPLTEVPSLSALWERLHYSPKGEEIDGQPVWMKRVIPAAGRTDHGPTPQLSQSAKHNQVEEWVETAATGPLSDLDTMSSAGMTDQYSHVPSGFEEDEDDLIDLLRPRQLPQALSVSDAPRSSASGPQITSAPSRRKKYGRVLKPEVKSPTTGKPDPIKQMAHECDSEEPIEAEKELEKPWIQARSSRKRKPRPELKKPVGRLTGLNIFEILSESGMDGSDHTDEHDEHEDPVKPNEGAEQAEKDKLDQEDEEVDITMLGPVEIEVGPISHMNDLLGLTYGGDDDKGVKNLAERSLDGSVSSMNDARTVSSALQRLWGDGGAEEAPNNLLDDDPLMKGPVLLAAQEHHISNSSDIGGSVGPEKETENIRNPGEMLVNNAPSTLDTTTPGMDGHHIMAAATAVDELGFKDDENGPIVSQLASAIAQMLDLARSYRGRLNLKIHLGRSLLSNVPKQSIKVFDAHEWREMIFPTDGSSPPSEGFTRRLSEEIVDVNHLLTLRSSEGHLFFDLEPNESEAMYEFHCIDTEGSEMVVEVDAQTFSYEIVTSTRDFGSASINQPGRTWDARFEMEGKSYHPAPTTHACVPTLVSTLFIPATASTSSHPSLYTLTPPRPPLTTSSPSQSFTITRILTRRSTSHACIIHPNIALIVKEVQELFIRRNSKLPGAVHAYADPSTGEGLWYEVSIANRVMEEALEGNAGLELGEDAEWDPISVVQAGRVKDWMEVVSEVVKGADRVGAGNIGALTREALREEAKREMRARAEAFTGLTGDGGIQVESVDYW